MLDGYAKDRLAVKPMFTYETDDLVAVASIKSQIGRYRIRGYRRYKFRRVEIGGRNIGVSVL